MFRFALIDFWVLRKGSMRSWVADTSRQIVLCKWACSARTGAHTPLVKLDAKEAHGLSESGITVRKGSAYTGRIILASSPATVVKVAFILGKGTADHQVITIRQLAPAYRKCSNLPKPSRASGSNQRNETCKGREIVAHGSG